MANSSLTTSVTQVETGGAPVFQCRFDYVSTSVTRLNRYDGSRLFINGRNEQIPSAGVELSNASLGANDTTYYVYAYMSSGVMTLEASATGTTNDSTYGHKIKSGDATRTLVGLVRKTVGNFVDSNTIRFTLSHYNRRHKSMWSTFGGGLSISNTGSLAVVYSATNLHFITFGEDAVAATFAASTYQNSGSSYVGIGLQLDGSDVGGALFASTSHGAGSSGWSSQTQTYATTPAVGYHYYAGAGIVDAGSVNFQAGTNMMAWGLMG